MRRANTLIVAFIAVVLALLTALLLVLSFRMHATLVDLNRATDQAVKIGDEINALFSGEVASIVGFQATHLDQYRAGYHAQRKSINSQVRSLAGLTPSLGPAVQARFVELESVIREWHRDVDARELTARRLPSDEFREMAFARLFEVRRAQASANGFNEAVLAYQSAQRARLQRLAYLFMGLAVIFGPLALLALVGMMHVMRRLSATTSYMENRARDEETLRQATDSLTTGLTPNDVVRGITTASALLMRADDVCIELVDEQRNEVTFIAGRGRVPTSGTTYSYRGSLAHDVLQAGQPRIIQSGDIEGQPESPFRNVIRRSENRGAMVIPLVTENHRLGAICLMRVGDEGFEDAEIPRARLLADVASIALHRALTFDKLQRMEDEDRFLARATVALSSSLDFERTIKTVVQLTLPRMADWCFLHLAERQRLYHAEVASADPALKDVARQLRDLHRGRSDLAMSPESVIKNRRALLIPELSDELLKAHSVNDTHFQLLRQLNLKSAMVVPLSVGHDTFGALVLVRTAGSPRYNTDDVSRVKHFAFRAALAIHNSQLYAVANDAILARDEVLGAVAHDLRNPVHAVQLSAQALAGSTLPNERHQKLLQSITGASQRMNRLIDDLLAVARMRADRKLPLDLHQEDPVHIVQEACQVMGPQALSQSVALRSSTSWNPMPSIIVDRFRIQQVFTNLLDNALKFTPPGGTITVSCDATDGEVRFAVKDTGRGIDPENVDRIFDPFWQSAEPLQPGAGLGLAIAKGLVEQHNGRIWVESARGVGTTVSFTIPVAGAHQEPLKAA